MDLKIFLFTLCAILGSHAASNQNNINFEQGGSGGGGKDNTDTLIKNLITSKPRVDDTETSNGSGNDDEDTTSSGSGEGSTEGSGKGIYPIFTTMKPSSTENLKKTKNTPSVVDITVVASTKTPVKTTTTDSVVTKSHVVTVDDELTTEEPIDTTIADEKTDPSKMPTEELTTIMATEKPEETTTMGNSVENEPREAAENGKKKNKIPNKSKVAKNVGAKNTTKKSGINFTMGIVIGVVVGAILAILIIVFLVYRLRKKDEGSYSLDEQSNAALVRGESNGQKGKEYFA